MIWYKVSLKVGLRKRWFKVVYLEMGPFFSEVEVLHNFPNEWKEVVIKRANTILSGSFTWFHKHKFFIGQEPEWFFNPFENKKMDSSVASKHWTEISDFNTGIGDIKTIWELSRFDWLTDLARAYRVSGNKKYYDKLQNLLADWVEMNPVNIGPNWKCGQETSIRIMKLFIASCILNQEKQMSSSLQKLIFEHIKRVEPNINYAIVQNNNHGTSEAVGLYLGALWLLNQKRVGLDRNEVEYLEKVKRKGRAILVERLQKLIDNDGTFSQNSTNYHRVVVDTLCYMLKAMEMFNEPDFPSDVNEKLVRLLEWQKAMIFGEKGEVPNLGSNDGSMLNNLHNCDYTDFRPSTQLFSVLLKKERVFHSGIWDEPLFWFGKHTIQEVKPLINKNEIKNFDNRFIIIKNERIKILFVIPSDSFRPNNDPFHVDVWIDGKPILIDAGTYSYNHATYTKVFKSIASHNTVQFGEHEPMPNISRFLSAEWIKATELTFSHKPGELWVKSSYKDYLGNKHTRKIELNSKSININDQCGPHSNTNLYFHLSNGLNVKESNSSNDVVEYDLETVKMRFESNNTFKSHIFDSMNSRFYLDHSAHKALKVTINSISNIECNIQTTIELI